LLFYLFLLRYYWEWLRLYIRWKPLCELSLQQQYGGDSRRRLWKGILPFSGLGLGIFTVTGGDIIFLWLP
jgi:hypothetical protein